MYALSVREGRVFIRRNFMQMRFVSLRHFYARGTRRGKDVHTVRRSYYSYMATLRNLYVLSWMTFCAKERYAKIAVEKHNACDLRDDDVRAPGS